MLTTNTNYEVTQHTCRCYSHKQGILL